MNINTELLKRVAGMNAAFTDAALQFFSAAENALNGYPALWMNVVPQSFRNQIDSVIDAYGLSPTAGKSVRNVILQMGMRGEATTEDWLILMDSVPLLVREMGEQLGEAIETAPDTWNWGAEAKL